MNEFLNLLADFIGLKIVEEVQHQLEEMVDESDKGVRPHVLLFVYSKAFGIQ